MTAKDFTSGQQTGDTQNRSAAGDQTPPNAIRPAAPIVVARSGSDHPPTTDLAIPIVAASAGQLPSSQSTTGAQLARAAGTQTAGGGQGRREAQSVFADPGPILADPVLGICADVVDDLERVRIANENRLRALTTEHGLTLLNPDVARLSALVDSLKATEHQAILNVQRVMRKHPLGVWAKPVHGVGEKQLARLLATIGDPYWNDLHDRPRTVSELWAFCGYHVIRTSGGHPTVDTQRRRAGGSNAHPSSQSRCDTQPPSAAGVAPKRQRGQKSNWNEDARKRAWLIANSCVKQPPGTRYRDVYDNTRAKYANAIHNEPCVRCGPAGKPAPTGSPLSLGHQHARGLRAIAKELLEDLWRESKRIHEDQSQKEAA